MSEQRARRPKKCPMSGATQSGPWGTRFGLKELPLHMFSTATDGKLSKLEVVRKLQHEFNSFPIPATATGLIREARP
jgi:hypothetical protein